MKVKIGKIIAPVIFGAVALIIAASASLQFIAHRISITPAGALGAVQSAGAFSSVGGELDIEESQSTGIKLMSARIAPEDYAENGIDPQAASAYTLTATVYPEDATYKALDWSLAWNQTAIDPEYGVNLYDNDEWYNYYTEDDAWDVLTCDLINYGITEYDFLTITPNVDGGNILTITCKQEFGCPINITCTARDGSGVSATCKVDYARKTTNIFLNANRAIIPTEYSRSDTNISYSIWTSKGTLKPETTITATASIWYGTEWTTAMEDYGINIKLPYGYYFYGENPLMEYEDTNGVIELTSSTVFTYNTTWDTFCDRFIVRQAPNLTESQKRANRDAARQMLQAFADKGVLSTLPIFTISFYAKDSFTGKEYRNETNFYISDVSKIPVYTTNVSNIELPESIVL